MDKNLLKLVVDLLRDYNNAKKEEGLIPTIDLFIEEMEEMIAGERQDEGEPTPEELQEKADEARHNV